MWLLRFSLSIAALLCRPDNEDPAGAFAVDNGRPAVPPECRGAEEDDVLEDEDEEEDDEEEDDEEELCPEDFPPPAG